MAEQTERDPDVLYIGDVVIARFTERGKAKTVRAHVIAIDTRRGKVEINWVHTSSRGREIGWSQKTKWVALADVRKVEKKPGARAPNEAMRGIVSALAGKDVDLG